MRWSMLFLAIDHSLELFLFDELLIKYWPFANSPKEVMFISELIDKDEAVYKCQIENKYGSNCLEIRLRIKLEIRRGFR